mgnify:CR=1 FL=1
MGGESCTRSNQQEMPAPAPKVEITVERLEGIVWSTSKSHKNREELNKNVPFVTAAVEFSGTCPNMKVYHASRYPHLENPAVESYFATLAPEYTTDKPQQQQSGTNKSSNEIKKITTLTTQEMGGTRTKTTTTTITTISTSTPKPKVCKDGQYPLVATWHDHSTVPEKSSDGNTIFTMGEEEDRNDNPHLTLTMPTSQEKQAQTIFEALASPCHSVRETAETSFEMIRNHHKLHGKKSGKNNSGLGTDTFSTAAETVCSAENTLTSASSTLAERLGKPGEKIMDLDSLLDNDSEDDDESDKVKLLSMKATYQDEAEIPPVLSSHKSKELAAAAIAAEPSSGVVGKLEDINETGPLTPLSSWMSCGTTNPEIIELRVRVIPEDADDFDEMDPSAQHLPASQDLEGVAHLVFLDQAIEEGTTVMDLPLKISHEAKLVQRDRTTLSTTPHVDLADYVTLGPNARLRVRITVRATPDQNTAHSLPPVVHNTSTTKTNSIPEQQLPFYSRSISMMLPMMERILQMPTHIGGERNSSGKNENEKAPSRDQTNNDSFTQQFRAVLPEEISKRAETFLGDWKSYSESWSLSKTIQALSDAISQRTAYKEEDIDEGDDVDDDYNGHLQWSRGKETKRLSKMKTPTARTSSTLSQSTVDSLFTGLER